MKPLLTAALVLACLCVHSQTLDRRSGNVKGNVADQNGNPVYGATVYAVPQDLMLDGISPRSVRADNHGAFDFKEGLAWGDYKLYACKDKDGYPNPLDGFYADSQPDAAHVELREDNPVADVPVTLGEKAGTITGRVLDADTGAPLKARVAFIREDGKGDHGVTSRSKDGKYRALVPPRVDLIVMVMVMVWSSTMSMLQYRFPLCGSNLARKLF